MTNYLSTLIFFLLLLAGGVITAGVAAGAGPGLAALTAVAWFILDVVVTSGVRLAAQWERGVVFRLGKYRNTRGPGLFLVVPVVDSVTLVDTRIRTMDIPAQQVITKDNVPVKINGVVFYQVSKVEDAIIKVQDYRYAIAQYAQTALRDIIGQMSLDQLLSEREQIGKMIKQVLVDDTKDWGLTVTAINMLDIDMPEDLKKMMSRQASAEREKRATITKAEGDREAALNLAAAAETMATSPGAMQLRTLQTVDGLGPTASNTVIIAVPVEMMDAMAAIARGAKPKAN